MAYESDALSQNLARFLYEDEQGLYFKMPKENIGLPVTEDEIFSAQETLKYRSTIAKCISIPSAIVITWVIWKIMNETDVLLYYTIAALCFIFSFSINFWALFSVLRPFQKRLLTLLITEHGWQRIGLNRALAEQSSHFVSATIAIILSIFMILRGNYYLIFYLFIIYSVVFGLIYFRARRYGPFIADTNLS